MTSPGTQTTNRQLFGTDGIRGVAGEYPLNPATVFAIGRALGSRLKRANANARVVFGQDTRESSAWISETLARGLQESGVGIASAGILTTPGVAYLTRTHGFAAGIVVSASHNPWQDNGIKLFGPDGMKLADAMPGDQRHTNLPAKDRNRSSSEQNLYWQRRRSRSGVVDRAYHLRLW